MAVNKVVATENARHAATRIQALLNGTITTDIRQLQTIGDRLADPSAWDGPSAVRFRQVYWPPANRALHTAVHDLETLARHMEAVVQAVLEAGGGGPIGGPVIRPQ